MGCAKPSGRAVRHPSNGLAQDIQGGQLVPEPHLFVTSTLPLPTGRSTISSDLNGGRDVLGQLLDRLQIPPIVEERAHGTVGDAGGLANHALTGRRS
jgi:hypothetical protein